MARKIRQLLTLEVCIRVVADIFIVNISYLLALVLRLLWDIEADSSESVHAKPLEALQIYVFSGWLLTLLSVLAFSLCGFYSRGRLYQGRFKALAIFQGVTGAYVAFACALFFMLAHDSAFQPPRSALLAGWLITLVATEGARLWSSLWRLATWLEGPKSRDHNRNGRIRHVLVIGGAGYIGSVLCRQLLAKGYSVRVLDAFLYGRESIADLMTHPRFQIIEGDSREVSAVFRAMLDMDAVVHLGELVGDPACALDERLTLEVNVAATRMVAEAAKGCRVKRFIYASSCSVYGANSDTLDECSELNPVSLYAKAKIGSEQALLGLNGSDFHPVILRFATVFGLSPRPRFDLVVNLLTAKAVLNRAITVFGGDQWRPFVHVADVAGGIINCLEAPLFNVKGQIFNLGSDENNYTIDDLGDQIQKLIPEANVIKESNDADKRDYRVSFRKIRRELGFEPRYSLEDGILEIQAAIEAGAITDIGHSKYNNYRTLVESRNRIKVRGQRITPLYAPEPLVEEPPVDLDAASNGSDPNRPVTETPSKDSAHALTAIA
jgi:nucleoside-diphosphate-sugar epimerase